MEGMEKIAELFDLRLNDLWEDYRDREWKITQAAIDAAESARVKFENKDSPFTDSGRDYSTLPQWARDEIARLAFAAARAQNSVRDDHHQSLNAREKRSLLNVVGSLVETCLSQSPGGQRYSISLRKLH